MSNTLAAGVKAWCPLCRDFSTLIRVRRAARLVDMHSRTIYRYIEEGKIHAVKVGGSSYRVCTGCLVNPQSFLEN
jgi:excisionase family DNA binding protein